MHWNNRGTTQDSWQLDHIVGCNNFDLSKEEDKLVCFKFTNFQPLWLPDHQKKSKILISFRSPQ